MCACVCAYASLIDAAFKIFLNLAIRSALTSEIFWSKKLRTDPACDVAVSQ